MSDPLDEAAALTAQLTEAYVRHHQDRPRVVPRARCRVCDGAIPSGRQAIGADTCVECQRVVERKR